MRSLLLLPCLVLAFLLVFTGCTAESGTLRGSYSVDHSGRLILTCPHCTVEETQLFRHEGYTLNRVILRNPEGDVYALAALPDTPVAGFVLAPGAGVRKEGHLGRAEMYARDGYAFIVLDMRENGGETGGYPFNLERDYQRFEANEWPQYYLSVCDIQCARAYLQGKYPVPVYAAGESNGGRYAAIAAELDPGFSGYIGISTSSFSRAGDTYTGDPRRFLLSIDPETCAAGLAGRTSWILHSPDDPVIPYTRGQSWYAVLPEPKAFFSINGTHGLNGEADTVILGECAQIYGSAG